MTEWPLNAVLPPQSVSLALIRPAQHAQRQGNVVGYNIAASLGYGRARPYRHKDLGLVAGAGYTGTEVVAQTHRWLSRVASRWTHLDVSDVRWVLVDVAPRVLPELGPRLGGYALSVLRGRGVEVRLGAARHPQVAV